MRIDYTMVCESALIDQSVLEGYLYDALSNGLESEVSEDLVNGMVAINYSRLSSSPSPQAQWYICGFSVEFDEIDESSRLRSAFSDFNQILLENGAVHILKFYDDLLLNLNIELIKEVFEIEMLLRKAISIAYIRNYPGDYYNLLRDDSQQISTKEKPLIEHMEMMRENEFFYLLFSQYISLNRPKVYKLDEMLNIIKRAGNYEEMRAEVQRIPVNTPEDLDFLAAIVSKINAIEKVRNCIAHNRAVGERQLQDYRTASSELRNVVEDYMERTKDT